MSGEERRLLGSLVSIDVQDESGPRPELDATAPEADWERRVVPAPRVTIGATLTEVIVEVADAVLNGARSMRRSEWRTLKPAYRKLRRWIAAR